MIRTTLTPKKVKIKSSQWSGVSETNLEASFVKNDSSHGFDIQPPCLRLDNGSDGYLSLLLCAPLGEMRLFS